MWVHVGGQKEAPSRGSAPLHKEAAKAVNGERTAAANAARAGRGEIAKP